MKKRKDSFFGIHFDFHAVEGQVVGEDFRPEVVAELLDKTKPDFVQCDTKGHFGYSSYPTKVGNQATEIRHDVLKMWRELTRERDIALYVHHSGIFDMLAAKQHPDWAIKDENGVVSDKYMSAFSPYADELLIPQLKEMALDYGVDGAWVDGEYWASFTDYSDHAVNAYKAKYHRKPPRSTDPDFEGYRQFCRDGFFSYVTHYIEEVKKVRPDFEITSNWIYSGYMQEKRTVPVDFLSGDYSTANSLESARQNARALAARGITWDLMAWGQHAIPESYATHNRNTKEFEQYCQEAAMVIVLGGGFQFFNIMYGGGGTVQPWMLPTWERVAKFCREREFCHKSKPVHQIGVINPLDHGKHAERIWAYNGKGTPDMFSLMEASLDCGYSTEIVYQSEPESIGDYPLIILPYTPDLSPDIKRFEDYVTNGGRLIVDLGAAHWFEDFAGIRKAHEEKEKLLWLEGNGALGAMQCDFAEFEGDFTMVGRGYERNYFVGEPLPCAINKHIGKGSITFMCVDFGGAYKQNISSAVKDFFRGVIDATGFEPLVSIDGSAYAELVVTEKGGKLIVNVTNLAGPHREVNVRGYNEVPKIGPITVSVRHGCIKKVTRMPEGERLQFEYKNGCAEFTFDTVHIHTAAIIEFEEETAK